MTLLSIQNAGMKMFGRNENKVEKVKRNSCITYHSITCETTISESSFVKIITITRFIVSR